MGDIAILEMKRLSRNEFRTLLSSEARNIDRLSGELEAKYGQLIQPEYKTQNVTKLFRSPFATVD